MGRNEGITYMIIKSDSRGRGAWGAPLEGFKCLNCGRVSYNPHDVEQRYCGACHVFHDEPGAELAWQAKGVKFPVS